MRKRYRVKSVALSKNKGSLIVITKGGLFALPLNKYFGQRLEHYFPHLYHLFKGQAIEIRDLLVGRYAYGVSRDTLFGKTITKHLA